MARPSTIDRLPKKIREKITFLRDKGRTIDEILENLEQLDVDVSRSALGRHLKKQKQVAEQIRRSRQLAEAVGRQFGDSETSQVARTNIELLHSLLMKVMIGGEEETEQDVVLSPKEAMFAASAIEKLSKASKLDVDRELKIREEAEKQALKKAADIVDKTGKEKGLSAEMVNELKAKFLGVKHDG